MANEEVMTFDGTPSTVITTTGTIADGIFTVASTNATITEFDNSTDLWPRAVATLKLPDTFLAAPDAGSTIDLYMAVQDLAGDTADDETAPTTTDQKGAKWIASFRLYATDENQPKQEVISLLGVQKAKFYLQNNSGTTMSFSAGATLEIEGFTLEPAA